MMIQEQIKTRAEVLEEFSEAYDARFFKTLGEPVRIQVLSYLMMNGRSDIGSITENMLQDRSVVSRHLNQIYAVGMLCCEKDVNGQCYKETRHMHYSINAQVFTDKLERFLTQIKKSITVCCPPGCCSK